MLVGGGTSIGTTLSPVSEVLPKPTLTLFVKKPFPFWREKFFQNKKLRVSTFDLKRTFSKITYLVKL
jgi:hypothetical protein